MTIDLIHFALTGLVLASLGYYLICMVAAVRFFTSPGSVQWDESPPVSIMIPLCGADFEAYENYTSLCRLDYPAYEIVFGVHDPLDSSVPVVRKLMGDFPSRDIQLVVGKEVIGKNPKVNNLHNMLARAKYEHILVLDSDIRVEPDFLRKVVSPLSDGRVGLVTCLYRSGKAENLASLLEAIGITGEFAPGVLAARSLEEMSFSLGAVMATSRGRLKAIGGFEAVADYLADDFMLGKLLWKAGYRIRLLPDVVETIHPHAGFLSMLKHQIRWGRGIRACRPVGYLGSVVTHGPAIAFIHAALARGSPWSLLLLCTTIAAQVTMGWLIGVRCLGDSNLKRNIWLLPVRDLLGFLIWCCSILGREVEWRGKTFRLLDDGRIAPIRAAGPPCGRPECSSSDISAH